MSLLHVAEVFGQPLDHIGDDSRRIIENKECPFKKGKCNKGGLKDPLGICSYTDGQSLATVCPNRFAQDQKLFREVGRLAFGQGARIAVIPEYSLLRIPGKGGKKIGKIDFLISKLDANGNPTDFAALEVQSVYISGRSMREPLHAFLRTGAFPEKSQRRPDWRSSTQKRLMPQLSLKVPVFRRWGKKFFVAVDSLFFESMPAINTTQSFSNSEITWAICSFGRGANQFQMDKVEFLFSFWDDVLVALREGIPPEPDELLAEITHRLATFPHIKITV